MVCPLGKYQISKGQAYCQLIQAGTAVTSWEETKLTMAMVGDSNFTLGVGELYPHIEQRLNISRSQIRVTTPATRDQNSTVEVTIFVLATDATREARAGLFQSETQLGILRSVYPSAMLTGASEPVSVQTVRRCTAGKYHGDGAASNECADCPSNKYSNNVSGMGLCTPHTSCSAGSYVLSQPSISSDRECQKCAAGMFSIADNVATCTACVIGKYQPDTGFVYCLDCLTDLANSVTKTGTLAVSVERCVCKTGYFLANVDPVPGNVTTTGEIVTYFARAGKECKRCPVLGVDCKEVGLTAYTLVTLEGYWRATNSTDVFYPCTDSLAKKGCAGGLVNSSTDQQCADGHTGLRCAVCDFEHGYVSRFDVHCGKCAENEARNALIITAVLAAISLCCLRYWHRLETKLKKEGGGRRAQAGHLW